MTMGFETVFRSIGLTVLVALGVYMFLLTRSVITELRGVDDTMREVLRVLKEIRDHQKGIKRRKIKSE